MAYVGQFGQDAFLDRVVFRGRSHGCFVDVGAHDGETFSNTVFFERERGWHGLCIEPNPTAFARLRRVRRAECLPICIAAAAGTTEFLQIEGGSEMLSGILDAYSAKHRERIEVERRKDGSTQKIVTVAMQPLRSVLAERSIDEVDLLSVDTEGSEVEVLNSIDYARVLIHVVTIENFYDDDRLSDLLRPRGFVPLIRLAADIVFVNRRSPVFSRRLLGECLMLRAAARIERKLRRLRLIAPGTARFPYKRAR